MAGQDDFVPDDFVPDDFTPAPQQQQSQGNFLTTPWAPKINYSPNESFPERMMLEGYNRFIQPMSAPLGAMMTGFMPGALGLIGKAIPKFLGLGAAAGVAGGAYGASHDLPEFINE